MTRTTNYSEGEDAAGFVLMLTLAVYPIIVAFLSQSQAFTLAESSIIAIPIAVIAGITVLPALAIILIAILVMATSAFPYFIHLVVVFV